MAMYILYEVFLFLTLAVVLVGNNESWTRKLNIKFGFVPTSNVFRDCAPYLIVITIICGIAYLRGLIV